MEVNGREYIVRVRGFVREKEGIEKAVIKEVNGVSTGLLLHLDRPV